MLDDNNRYQYCRVKGANKNMIKKDLAAQLLNSYKPACKKEKRFKDDMLVFLNRYDDCFERTLAVGHFTASCWFLDKTGDSALLTHHAKLNRWLQLGGHCDGNPNLLAVALKEAQEESGIEHIVPVSTEIFDIDIHLIPASKKEKAHYHYDVRFLLQVASDEKIVCSKESHDLRWFTNNTVALPNVNSSVQRMFKKWQQS